MEYKDYYRILEVDKKADEKAIKNSYRKLARKYHPDLNPGDKAAEEKLKEINEAYEVLSDPEKRKQYDELGSNWEQYSRMGAQGGFRNAGGSGYTYSYNAQDGDFSDFFRMFFGGGGFGAEGFGGSSARWSSFDSDGIFDMRAGQSQAVEVELTLEEAFSGATRVVQTPASPKRGKPGKVEVKIPAGVVEGSKVRAGGVLLVVKLKPHPRFEIKDRDVTYEQPVSVVQAVLGTEIEVPTLKGTRVRMKIPAGTDSGKTFRLKGLGIPGLNGSVQGDQLVRIRIEVPKSLSGRRLELYKELAAIEEA